MDHKQPISDPLTDLNRREDWLMPDLAVSRHIVRDNLNALMSARPDLDSNSKLAARTSLGSGTISRIRNAESATTVDTLDILAKAFEVEAWQLVAPNLGNLPSLLPMTKAERVAYESLRTQIQANIKNI